MGRCPIYSSRKWCNTFTQQFDRLLQRTQRVPRESLVCETRLLHHPVSMDSRNCYQVT